MSSSMTPEVGSAENPSTCVVDQRGGGRRLKRLLPKPVFRAATVAFNKVVAAVPYGIKYPIGTSLRRGKLPYNLISDGDVVVQVGAPRDILLAARSRALHFMRLVGSGKVLVVEPDPENIRTLKAFTQRHGLASRLVLCECGGWSEKKDLVLLSSPDHPAATVLETLGHVPDGESAQYERHVVPVDTIDNMLESAGLGVPKLVSITTNGAELEIVKGMKDTIARGCRYISLAYTGPGYTERMQELGYALIGHDDRGFTYEKKA